MVEGCCPVGAEMEEGYFPMRLGVEMEEGYCPMTLEEGCSRVGVGMEVGCCPTMQAGGCFPVGVGMKEGCCPVEIEWDCSVGVEMGMGMGMRMRMGMAQLLGSYSPCSDSQCRRLVGACWKASRAVGGTAPCTCDACCS